MSAFADKNSPMGTKPQRRHSGRSKSIRNANRTNLGALSDGDENMDTTQEEPAPNGGPAASGSTDMETSSSANVGGMVPDQSVKGNINTNPKSASAPKPAISAAADASGTALLPQKAPFQNSMRPGAPHQPLQNVLFVSGARGGLIKPGRGRGAPPAGKGGRGGRGGGAVKAGKVSKNAKDKGAKDSGIPKGFSKIGALDDSVRDIAHACGKVLGLDREQASIRLGCGPEQGFLTIHSSLRQVLERVRAMGPDTPLPPYLREASNVDITSGALLASWAAMATTAAGKALAGSSKFYRQPPKNVITTGAEVELGAAPTPTLMTLLSISTLRRKSKRSWLRPNPLKLLIS
jgi:hypothetical protein